MKRWGVLLFLLIIIVVSGWYGFFHNPAVSNLPELPRKEPLRIAIVGDSLAYGTGAKEKDPLSRYLKEYITKYPSVEIENLGTPGARIKNVADSQVPSLTSNYNAAVILVGANDVTQLGSNETFRPDYQKALATLAKNAKRVVVVNVPRLSLTPAIPAELKGMVNGRTQSANEVIAEVVKAHNNAVIFDFYRYSEEKLFDGTGLLSEDNYHPNDRGYELLAKEIARLL